MITSALYCFYFDSCTLDGRAVNQPEDLWCGSI